MKPARLAALLALGLSAAITAPAAERTGPAADDVIYPRGAADATTVPAENGANSAQSIASPGVFAPPTTPSFGGAMPALGYLVALGLLIGGVWFVLKRGAMPRPFRKADGKLQVLETRLLGNRQFLVVVEYEDAKMLLGVCPGRIDYLTPLAGHPLASSNPTDDAESAAPIVPGLNFAERR